jgi:hypothetical protein
MVDITKEKSSKLVYLSMCSAYDVIVGNKECHDSRYEYSLFQKGSMEKILKYFEEIEEYEKCALLKRIIDEVYE